MRGRVQIRLAGADLPEITPPSGRLAARTISRGRTRIMKDAVLREVRTPLQIEEVQIGKPGPHEVLIRTVAAGVCHSDLHFIEGSYPAQMPVVLGHESAGIVEQVGSAVRTCAPG